MTAIFRKCRECGLEAHTEEELELFTKAKRRPYGRATICKKCHRENRNKRYEENKEVEKACNKKYYRENKETTLAQQKKYYEENKGKKLKVAKNREQRNREALKEYLGGTYRCEHCGFEHPTSAPFDFHHINPDEKEGEIGHLVRSASIKRLEKEVDKCILLCSNCHRIEHERLRNEQKNSNS